MTHRVVRSTSRPWLKRIDYASGLAQRLVLPSNGELHLERRGKGFSTTIARETHERASIVRHDTSWHCTVFEPTTLSHGSQLDLGDALYVFMDTHEARHPGLEASIGRNAGAELVYADWLEEQSDPFAVHLRQNGPSTNDEQGDGSLEGLDRVPGMLRVERRHGFVRCATLGPYSDGRPWELLIFGSFT